MVLYTLQSKYYIYVEEFIYNMTSLSQRIWKQINPTLFRLHTVNDFISDASK